MPNVMITTNLDITPWSDLERSELIVGEIVRIGLMPDGTSTGKAAVLFYAEGPDGHAIIVQTTWKMLRSAVGALIGAPVVQMEDL